MATKEQKKREILKWFKNMQVIYLATMKGVKPQVRPVTLVRVRNKFWVLTGAGDAKIRQIKGNNAVQFCLSIKRGRWTGYVRADCRARIVKDRKKRRQIAEHVSFFKTFWKTPDDPAFALLEVIMKQIEYLKPGTFYAERIKV